MRWRDRRLIQGIRGGDAAARGRLLDDVYPRLYAYLCHLCRNRDQAADLAQEAAIRVWRALPEFDFRATSSFLAWAHRIAHNVYVDAMRAAQGPPALSLDQIDPPAPMGDLAEGTAAHAEEDAALAAVARLPEIYRQAVVLRFMQGLAYREVADVLDIPPGTVRSRLAKALELLRADLTGKEDCDDLRTRATDNA